MPVFVAHLSHNIQGTGHIASSSPNEFNTLLALALSRGFTVTATTVQHPFYVNSTTGRAHQKAH